MAFTYTDFKKSLKGIFGAKRSVVSGDGGGDVDDHCARLHERIQGPFVVAAAAASGTSSFAMVPAFVAENECDLKTVRVVIDAACTLTVTDHIVLNLIKKKSATWSATENLGTLLLNRTATWGTNVAGMSKAFTLATTTSVLDLDPGDTICINGTLAGANATGCPKCSFYFNVEEK
jgi:hypothetical protein